MALPVTYQVDITRPLQPTPLIQMLVSGDSAANEIIAELYDGDSPASVTGTCEGYAVRHDKRTVPLESSREDNALSVTLNEEAYAIPGQITIVIKLVVTGTSRTTYFFGYGTVLQGESGTYINPGEVIPNITELMAAIDAMEAATAAAEAAAASIQIATLAETKAFLDID